MTAPPAGALESSRESQMVVLERDASGTPTIWCDPEIVDLVRALNTGDLRTVASCSGHGEQHGNIALKDGRELLIAPDYDTARQMERALLAALRLREWRPIETAPKDEPVLVLFDGTGIPEIMELTRSGWVWANGIHRFTGDHPPTHWMPLPAPPTADDLARILEEGK